MRPREDRQLPKAHAAQQVQVIQVPAQIPSPGLRLTSHCLISPPLGVTYTPVLVRATRKGTGSLVPIHGSSKGPSLLQGSLQGQLRPWL